MVTSQDTGVGEVVEIRISRRQNPSQPSLPEMETVHPAADPGVRQVKVGKSEMRTVVGMGQVLTVATADGAAPAGEGSATFSVPPRLGVTASTCWVLPASWSQRRSGRPPQAAGSPETVSWVLPTEPVTCTFAWAHLRTTS